VPPQAQEPVTPGRSASAKNRRCTSASQRDLSANQITDYVHRVVQPKLQAVQGGAERARCSASVSTRCVAWLDPAATRCGRRHPPRTSTPRLQNNNYLSALGSTKGRWCASISTAATDLHTRTSSAISWSRRRTACWCGLKDVANVVLGAEDYDSTVAFKGKRFFSRCSSRQRRAQRPTCSP